MILRKLFDAKYALYEQLENCSSTKKEYEGLFKNLLYQNVYTSRILTLEDSTFDFREEAEQSQERLQIDFSSEQYSIEDASHFLFLFEVICLAKDFYPAFCKTSLRDLSIKLNEIMRDREKQEIICEKATLINYLQEYAKRVDVLSNNEKEIVTKVYGNKVPVVNFDSFLVHVEEIATHKMAL